MRFLRWARSKWKLLNMWKICVRTNSFALNGNAKFLSQQTIVKVFFLINSDIYARRLLNLDKFAVGCDKIKNLIFCSHEGGASRTEQFNLIQFPQNLTLNLSKFSSLLKVDSWSTLKILASNGRRSCCRARRWRIRCSVDSWRWWRWRCRVLK